MLETTFLGHQGWRFATAGATILVDPLPVEPFGHNGGGGRICASLRTRIRTQRATAAGASSAARQVLAAMLSNGRYRRRVCSYNLPAAA